MFRNKLIITLIYSMLFCLTGHGQVTKKSYDYLATFDDLETALKEPEKVEKLVLKRERLKEFPVEIFKFKNLKYIDLGKNKLDSLPENIDQLENLEVLILEKNKITTLPEGIYRLYKLKILVLGSNDVGYLSKQISNLQELEVLDLWNTNVGNLPEELSKLPKLQLLDLRGIAFNVDQQEELLNRFDHLKLLLSPPCNCNF